MYYIEYKHKRSLSKENWKPLKIGTRTAKDASQAVENLTKLYGEDFEFRSDALQLLSNVKPV